MELGKYWDNQVWRDVSVCLWLIIDIGQVEEGSSLFREVEKMFLLFSFFLLLALLKTEVGQENNLILSNKDSI